MKVLTNKNKLRAYVLSLIVTCISITSCDSILGEENVDCSVEYRVKFKYDYNLKYADAFAHEVRSVTLYAFDENGKFVYQSTEQGDMLGEAEYSMPVEIQPGNYELVTWAGLEKEESFSVPVLTQGVSTIEDLNCTMNRNHIISRAADGSAYVDKDLVPLFHGQVKRQVFTRAATSQIITVPLVKNTNNVRVVLQHLSGDPVEVDKFTFTIQDENGMMNYDNSLLKDEKLTYYAWHTDQGSADMGNTTSRATTSVGVAIAELTVGRLVTTNRPILSIFNKDGEKVLSIPLIDYALLVKGNYNRKMDDQEYLDRQDEYNMTFFLDSNDKWVNSSIIINGWKVVLSDADLK